MAKLAQWFKPGSWLLALGLITACGDDDHAVERYTGPRSCSIEDQNAWLLDLMHEVYLWNNELPTDIDPAAFETPSELIRAVRFTEFDRWSRVSDKTTTKALFEEGKVIAMGFRTRTDDEGRLRVAFVLPGAPADLAGLQRGDEVLAINGYTIDAINEGDLWGDIYGPNEPGVAVRLRFAPANHKQTSETPREVELVKTWVELVTVPIYRVIEHDGITVGYLLFESFVDTSEDELNTAFEAFQAAGVEHVIVDLRYNGGGRVWVARHLIALLIASIADGETSYQVRYNDDRSERNTIRTIATPMASLGSIQHAVFLTTGSTASASELVMNSVRAHVQTSFVGTTTAGKPVGSNQYEFCDSIASPITFELLNANDEGRYFGGLVPNCESYDDLNHALGDNEESMVQRALSLISQGDCGERPEEEPSAAAKARVSARRHESSAPLLHPGVEELRGWM